MKVQVIKQVTTLEPLEDWGAVTAAESGNPKTSGLQIVISGREQIDTGVFDCTPGIYRRGVEQAEIMHFVAGSGSFTEDGKDSIHFRAGDTLFFEPDTKGTWRIDETIRKIYVIF
ncbi:cupin domain-containing protein [Paraburkholderia nodosa]|uniref:cupin domain-containing protein n=1 Tax=Paraburkholderia nodosa TaxID=392320 RepID=UPI0004800226|nr:cupin domain-containing protein [Paraburkholderia nodosa]